MDDPLANRITLIGRLNFRNEKRKFGIKRKDRRYHLYIVGKTGTGKSTLLENLVSQDVSFEEGLAVFDPHGDFVENIVNRIPEKRKDDVVYFNVPDPNCPYGFNPLAGVIPARRALAASEMIEALKKIWDKTWGPRMEYILRHTLLTLLEQPSATLADIRRLYFDSAFRKAAVSRVTNPEVKGFWEMEFSTYATRYKAESVAPIQNKIGAFLADPNLQRVLIEPRQHFDVRRIMDEGKILLVNLAKGKLGGDNSSLLGALLVSSIGLAALSRADILEEQRRDFYLYLDEFQNFTTLSMTNMLSELRKYRLNLIISHQYLDQLELEVRNAVLGNVGTIISFRVGVKDARLLEDEFTETFSKNDFLNLPNYNIYIKMMIDGAPTKPFSADTLLDINEIGDIRPQPGIDLTPADAEVVAWRNILKYIPIYRTNSIKRRFRKRNKKKLRKATIR